jgi:protein arginine kinase activator
MAESHKCQICGKPATVHLTQIIGNKIHKIDLCEECAKAKGITDPEGFSMGELLGSDETHSHVPSESVVCSSCGFTPKDFKKMGLFGCPDCYESFAPIIMPMLRTMHRDVTHRGKVPTRSLERMSSRTRLASLEAQLADAIKEERFEDAARLRDELSAIKKSLKTKSE